MESELLSIRQEALSSASSKLPACHFLQKFILPSVTLFWNRQGDWRAHALHLEVMASVPSGYHLVPPVL